MAAAGLVVQRPQQASTGCGDLQHGEVLPGNLGDLRVERLALIGHIGAHLPMGGDARQNGLLRFQIAEHGVAEDGLAATRVVVGIAAGAWAIGGEVDQFAGSRDGQAAQEDLVEHREHGGIAADAERERKDGYQGNDGGAAEGTEGETQIREHGYPFSTHESAKGSVSGAKNKSRSLLTGFVLRNGAGEGT